MSLATRETAAPQDARLRPSAGATTAFGALYVAVTNAPGTFWNVKLGTTPHCSGKMPFSLNCVPSDHGGETRQNAWSRGVFTGAPTA